MKVLYAGSFDPITNGHLDLIKRCSSKFDEVVVTIFSNKAKKYWFTAEERLKFIEESIVDLKNVTVDISEDMVANYCKKNDIKIAVRGLRAVSDYEYELSMSSYNKFLNEDLETVFLVASAEYSFVSSSGVKEIAQYDEKFRKLVPESVAIAIEEKLKTKLGGE